MIVLACRLAPHLLEGIAPSLLVQNAAARTICHEIGSMPDQRECVDSFRLEGVTFFFAGREFTFRASATGSFSNGITVRSTFAPNFCNATAMRLITGPSCNWLLLG